MSGNNPITLFVDAHSLDKGYQGTHTFLRELYQGLLAEYEGLDIYFGTYEPWLLQEIFPTVDSSRILQYKKVKPRYFRFLHDIPGFIRRYRFDYVHFQYLGVPWKTTARSIVTLHDVLYEDYPRDFPWSYRWIRSWLFARSLRRADIKTTVSDYSRLRISRHYGILEKAIHIIPNAVDSRIWNAHPSRESAEKRIADAFGIKNFLLYVSRVEPRKNHLLLLDKYLSLGLHKQGIALVFIGAPSIRVPQWQKRMSGLSPEERPWVHWIPQVVPEDLTAFYTACRLFVYPSKAEGFGIPPLEAALCGAPVLCSTGAAMKSFTFFDPYAFDPSDEKDLEEKLLRMIGHPPGQEFLSKVSNQVIRSYSRSGSARAFYSLINQRRIAWDYQSAS